MKIERAKVSKMERVNAACGCVDKKEENIIEVQKSYTQ